MANKPTIKRRIMKLAAGSGVSSSELLSLIGTNASAAVRELERDGLVETSVVRTGRTGRPSYLVRSTL